MGGGEGGAGWHGVALLPFLRDFQSSSPHPISARHSLCFSNPVRVSSGYAIAASPRPVTFSSTTLLEQKSFFTPVPDRMFFGPRRPEMKRTYEAMARRGSDEATRPQ